MGLNKNSTAAQIAARSPASRRVSSATPRAVNTVNTIAVPRRATTSGNPDFVSNAAMVWNQGNSYTMVAFGPNTETVG